MAIRRRFSIRLHGAPDAPDHEEALIIRFEKGRREWLLETPARIVGRDGEEPKEPAVDHWLSAHARGWMKNTGWTRYRFLDGSALVAFLEFCRVAVPEMTPEEAEQAAREDADWRAHEDKRAAGRADAEAARAERRREERVDLDERAAEARVAVAHLSGPRTASSRRSFDRIPSPPDETSLQALHIGDEGEVFLAGDDSSGGFVHQWKSGRVVRTTDRGRSYREARIDELVRVRAVGGIRGVLHAVGDSGAARSLDGGLEWEATRKLERGEVSGVVMAEDGRRFALHNGSLWVGSSGSAGWEPREVEVRGDERFYATALWVRGDVIVAVGLRDTIFRSTDGGHFFERVAVPEERESFTSIHEAGGILVAVGRGSDERGRPRILRSLDGGASFAETDVPDVGPEGYIYGIRATDVWGGGDEDWWVCGERGTLLHSRDAAATWGQVDLGTHEGLLQMGGRPGGELWILGLRGLWRSARP